MRRLTKIKNMPMVYVCILNFLDSFADYLSLPVLAIIFSSHVTLIQVGVLMGAPTIVSTFLGFISHTVNKRLKTPTVLIISSALYFICYLGFLCSDTFIVLFLFSLLKGCSRILWIPITKNLFSICSQDWDFPENAFKIRYCTICAASVIGPLLCGVIITIWAPRAAIYASISVYLFTLLVLLCVGRNFDINGSPVSLRSEESQKVLHLSRINWELVSYIIGGILVYLVFSQFEATFSLFLDFYFDNPGTVFSYLLTLNAVFCLLCQLALIRYPLRFSNKTILAIGNLFFCISFVMFAAFGGKNAVLVAAVFVYSIGEFLTIPAIDIAIDEITLPENKTLYFGLSEFRTLGFTLGPVLASFMLAKTTPVLMCVSFASIILLSTIFFVYPLRLSGIKQDIYTGGGS